jgi:5'-3' exonuclease
MGLEGLYKLIKDKYEECILETSLSNLAKGTEKKNVGVDANFFCCALSITHNKNVEKVLSAFKRNNLERLRAEGLNPIVVFDGGKLLEKATTLEDRKKRKMDDEEKKINLENMKSEASKIINEKKVAASAVVVSSSSSSSSSSPSGTTDDDENQSIIPVDPFVNVGVVSLDATSTSNSTTGDITLSQEDIKKILVAGKYDPEIINNSKDRKSKWVKELMEKQNYDTKINTVEKSSKTLDSGMVDEIYARLVQDGYTCIRSESEADFVIANLCRDGQIDYAFSEDSDFFAFGVKNIVRNFSAHAYDKSKPLRVYNLEALLKKIKFDKKDSDKETMDKFIEVCILCKCDYVPNGIKGIGIGKAYSGIKKFKTVEKFFKDLKKTSKKPLIHDENFLEQVKLARNLFHHPRNPDYLLNFGENLHEIFKAGEIRKIIFNQLF